MNKKVTIAFSVLILLLFKVASAQTYYINDIAGTGASGFAGDGYPAIGAQLYNPWGVTVDDSGNVYIADQSNGRIRKVDTKGIITTVVGTTRPIPPGDTAIWRTHGDGGLADTARLSDPLQVKFDSKGNMYIADWNNARVRKVDKKTGIITTYAGNGKRGYYGHGYADTASINIVNDIVFDKHDNMYITDEFNPRIVKVDTNGIISTIAGDGTQNNTGDGGLAVNAQLWGPNSLAFDKEGDLLFIDGLARIRKIDTNGIITTIAGNAGVHSGDGGPAVNAGFSSAWCLAVDDSDNIYVTEYSGGYVRKIYAATGIITTIAGNGNEPYFGNYVPALTAQFHFTQGISVDKRGFVYFTDGLHNKIRVLKPCNAITAFATDTPSLCKGSSVTLLANSANTFTWSPATGLNKTTGAMVVASPTVTTTYTVTGVNTNCPAAPVTIVVKVDNLHTPPVPHITPDNPTVCAGSATSLTASGGTAYLWANTSGVDCRSCAGIMAAPGDAITPFTVNVYSSPNCFATASILIHLDTLPLIQFTPYDTTPVVCPGSPVQISASGGGSYLWKGENVSCLTCASPVVSPTQNTYYQVTVINSNQCSSTDYIEVDVKTVTSNPGIISSTRDTICQGTAAKLIVSGSTGTLQWQLSTSGNNFNDISGATDSSYIFPSGQSAIFRVVASDGECADTSTNPYSLIVLPAPVATFTATVKGVQATFNPAGSEGAVFYNWDFGDGTTSADSMPVHTYAKDSTYNVCLTVYNGSNCSFTSCKNVQVGTSGVISVASNNNFKIYPQPFNNYLTITSLIDVQQVEVIDLLGRTLFAENYTNSTNNLQVNLTGLPKGAYYLKVKAGQTSFTQMVIKQ